MAEQKVCDSELQAQLVQGIRDDIEFLKTSIDKILKDMNGIRVARQEILERVDNVKNDSTIRSEQIQVTLGKTKRMLKRHEENRRRLEIVLKKVNDFNTQKLTRVSNPSGSEMEIKSNKVLYSILSGKGRIRLELADKNLMTEESSKGEDAKTKPEFKWGRDSALKELQWIVKMKLYKLRHHYERLPGNTILEDKTSLALPHRRSSEHA